jgi:hypothetical protein
MEHVEVESLAADRWRWIYSDGNGARAVSNELYEELLEAEAAARKAYPDLPIVVPGRLSDEQKSDQRSLIRLALFVMLAALAIALGWRIASRPGN